MKSSWKTNLLRVLILLFVIGLTIYLISIRNQINHLQEFGYPGIFLFSILSSATVLIPVPGVIATAAMGMVFNPFWVAIAAGAGAAIGELSGYLAGFSGSAVVENKRWYDRIEKWMLSYGDITILVLAFIPNPLFDLAGISAGMLKLPWYRFLLWCTAGKILKMLLFSYFGSYMLALSK